MLDSVAPVTPSPGMSDGLRAFLNELPANPPLQRLVSTATSLTELVELVRSAGHQLSVRELQLWAHHAAMDSAFWPWAGMDAEQRLRFFREG